MKTHISIFLLLLVFCSACSTGVTKDELRKWTRDAANGYYKEKQLGEYLVSCQLVPGELLKVPSKEQKAEFQMVIKGASKNQNLREALTKEFGSHVKRYFAFEVEKDILLEINGEKINPDFVHFEQGTDLSKDYRLWVSFDVEMPQDVTLVFEPKFLPVGKLKYKYTKNTLVKKPSLEKKTGN